MCIRDRYVFREVCTHQRRWLDEGKKIVPISINLSRASLYLSLIHICAVIGTGSKRRKYQLLKLRPDLKVVGIRGNIDTRLDVYKRQILRLQLLRTE